MCQVLLYNIIYHFFLLRLNSTFFSTPEFTLRIFSHNIFDIFFKKPLTKLNIYDIIMKSLRVSTFQYGGIAQLARALGSYPGCHWFESDYRYHLSCNTFISLQLIYGPLVKRLRHRPFTAESWVQFPYGSPHTFAHEWLNRAVCELLFFARKPPLGLIWVLFLSSSSFSKVESFCNGIASLDLVFSEHMPVDVQARAHLRMSEDTRNGCRVNSCAN